MTDHGKLIPYRLRLPEEFTDRPEPDPGINPPGHHIFCPLDITPGGAASVIPDTINHQPGFQAGTPPGQFHDSRSDMGSNCAIVPIRLPVGQHFPAGRSPVTVQDIIPVQAAAMVIIFYMPEGIDFRNIAIVSEGIRRKIDIKV